MYSLSVCSLKKCTCHPFSHFLNTGNSRSLPEMLLQDTNVTFCVPQEFQLIDRAELAPLNELVESVMLGRLPREREREREGTSMRPIAKC